MGILIQHGNAGDFGGDVLRGIQVGEQIRSRREEQAFRKAERLRQEKLDEQRLKESELNQQLGRQRLAAGEQAMGNAAEDQAWQQSERQRMTQQRADTRTAQDSELRTIGGERNLPVDNGGQGPEVSVLEGLPRELWGEYRDLQQQLGQTSDPEMRQKLISDAHKRWTGFVHLRGIDEVMRDMSHDIDTGAFQGDSESEASPQEQELIRQLRGSIDQISAFREQVAQNPEGFDPSHLRRIRDTYDSLKTKLAEIDSYKMQRQAALQQIDEMGAKWQGSTRMQNDLGNIRARLNRNVIKPDDALREADKIIREPDMYGEGRPFSSAPPDVQRRIRKEALDTAKDVMSGSDTWKYMSPSERSSALAKAQEEWQAPLARQYGWNPDALDAMSRQPKQGAPYESGRPSGNELLDTAPDAASAPEGGPQAGAVPASLAPRAQLSPEELTKRYIAAGLPPNIAAEFARASAGGASVAQIQEMLTRYRETGSLYPGTKGGKAKLQPRASLSSRAPSPGEEMNSRVPRPAQGPDWMH